MNLFGQPGQDGNALGGRAVIRAGRAGAEGNHDHRRGDDKNAGNNLKAQFHPVLPSVQDRVEKTHEDAVFLDLFNVFILNDFRHVVLHRRIQLRVGFQAAALHDAGADDGTAESPEKAHQGPGELSVADHRDNHHEAHAESRSEVGEGNELVFFEIGAEGLVLGQGNDGRVVGQECHHGTQGSHAGKVVQGLHERPQEALQQRHHAKLRHQLGKRTGKNGNAHQIEHGIEQQIVRGVHDGLEHVSASHPGTQEREDRHQQKEEYQGFHRGTAKM